VLLVGGALLLSTKGSSLSFLPGDYSEVADLATKTDFDFQDYSTYFRTIAEDKGAPYAYQVLLRAKINDGTDIHLFGHVIGDLLYKQQGVKGIYACTQDFRNACSHSVVIGMLNEHGEGALPEIADTCRKAPGGKGAYTMCFHGLGHGVLAFNDYKFDRAVDMCKKTGTAEYHNREYIECVGGATMEMIAGVHDPEVWKKEVVNWFKDSDPLFPCTAEFMPPEVQGICLVQLTPHLFTSAGIELGNPDPSKYAKAFSFCNALPKNDGANRSSCYGGFGKEFTVLAQGRDVRDIGKMQEPALKKVSEWCAAAGDTKGEADCNSYALSSLFWGGENTPDASLLYCGLASVSWKKECYQELGGSINFYLQGQDSSALCARFPAEYRSLCSRP
jgi:hypothetical protein